MTLPTDSKERKTYPIYTGFFDYFPDAIAAVAHHSYINNEKHNPGERLHWNRDKSKDETDALLRHVMEEDWVAVAWRAMAKLQKECEKTEQNQFGSQQDVHALMRELRLKDD